MSKASGEVLERWKFSIENDSEVEELATSIIGGETWYSGHSKENKLQVPRVYYPMGMEKLVTMSHTVLGQGG
ncbi:hypothetical protein RND71_001518 [Anisodus tanguticus]|uniref:Uncharacterized protein n=1 Tax=Anisodus tanguticus TaxID=243964 RepID=A0AAE1T2W5_9SOLA|nr:hypothetical protein RND71_001518 [Anisodus tanguticus]